MGPSRLGTAYTERFVLPVQIVQSQAANFTGSQAVDNEQHQDGAVALVGRPVAFGGGKKALDVYPGKPGGTFSSG